jgi:uncharacterized protein YjbI with pentapeptide repeats
MMTKKEINTIINNHDKWINNLTDGIRADLRNADLSNANLHRANLSNADLSNANLSNADLRNADLRNADLHRANLSNADLSNADLSNADLRNADLRNADLSNAQNVLSQIDYINCTFEKTADGYLAYKTFNEQYKAPDRWKIATGAIITENVDYTRTADCGCGVNVATYEWVKKHTTKDVWQVLIRWEWLAGVCVPYNTNGKIRCERVELIKVMEVNDANT